MYSRKRDSLRVSFLCVRILNKLGLKRVRGLQDCCHVITIAGKFILPRMFFVELSSAEMTHTLI